jgi:diadenosine tetraphosphate (Ap4A) HIT family hydrolase
MCVHLDECLGCALYKKSLKNEFELIKETKDFIVAQDVAIPIPGFLILSSKEHLKGIEDFSPEMRLEFIELMYKVRKSLSSVLNLDYVYIIQKEDDIEDNSHFHVWFFPRYKWMEKIGKGTGYLKPIVNYAKKEFGNEKNWIEVNKVANKLKEYFD